MNLKIKFRFENILLILNKELQIKVDTMVRSVVSLFVNAVTGLVMPTTVCCLQETLPTTDISFM